MSDPKPDDLVAFVSIKMYASGALSIDGHLGDAESALRMVEHAREQLRTAVDKSKRQIIVPARDVDVRLPATVTRAYGDIPIAERGDYPPAHRT